MRHAAMRRFDAAPLRHDTRYSEMLRSHTPLRATTSLPPPLRHATDATLMMPFSMLPLIRRFLSFMLTPFRFDAAASCYAMPRHVTPLCRHAIAASALIHAAALRDAAAAMPICAAPDALILPLRARYVLEIHVEYTSPSRRALLRAVGAQRCAYKMHAERVEICRHLRLALCADMMRAMRA